MKNIDKVDLILLENYAAGINKVVENIVVYPREFQITWNEFKPWSAKDSIDIGVMMMLFCSSDWFGEFLRERLLEVYDKEMVD